jgi:O-antigen/teichoic acid export membrane protein
LIAKAKALIKSKFVRNVAIVATGTAGAQAITMAFTPVITRLYGPEAFGLLGTFMAILSVLTPIAALTYPIAIVLVKSDADAKSLAKLSATLALAVAAITAIVLLVAGDWIAQALSLEAIAGFLLLIPIVMLFSAFQQILAQWLIRKKQFRITARVAVIKALTINSAKVGVGWFHPVGVALIVIAMIGQGLHAALLWSGIRSRETAHPNQDESTGTVRELARRHRDFPLYRAPQVALNAFSQSLPVLMLASFFGPAAAGFYTLARVVVGVPSTLIGESVANVFYPRISEAAHAGENLLKLLVRATSAMAVVGVVPFGVVVAFGPWLFSVVFGNEWSLAGEYARWLALWMYFGFLNSPSVAAIATLGLQDFFLLYEVVSVAVRALAIYIGFVIFKNDVLAVALFSLSGVLLNASLVMFTLSKSKRVPTSE